MAMLCEPIDKYVVETLLCSGGGKMSIEDIHLRRYNLVYNADCRAWIYFNIKYGEMNGEAI